MDWNWFFSSLSQSAAAIAGLFGAFVVTKIITNDAQFRQKLALLSEHINRSEGFSDRLGARYFHWYNEKSLRRDMDRFWRTLDDDKPEYKSPEEYYEAEGFSPYITREEILERIRRSIRLHSAPPRPKNDYPHLSIPPNFALDQYLRDQLEKERESIDSLVLELRAHIRDARSLLGDIEGNPESSPLINLAIGATLLIFFVGVIYPLSFLPVAGIPAIDYSPTSFLRHLGSLRGLLLFLLASVFTTVMGAFVWTNRRLRYPDSQVVALRRWSTLGVYSRYLKVLEENERAQVNQATKSTANTAAQPDV